MSDSHTALVAAGYLRRGLPADRIAARTGLSLDQIERVAWRLRAADRRWSKP